MMKKTELVKVVGFILIYLNLSAQVFAVQIKEGDEKEYFGVIRKRGWSKSGESYCQGGSDYYILEADSGVYALNSGRDPIRKTGRNIFLNTRKQLGELVDKKVKIKGKEISAVWTPAEHCSSGGQCIMGDLGCSWLRVIKITKTNKESP